MRVTMTQAWDRASDVFAGRQATLAGIAFATLWLPTVVQQAIGAAVVGDAPAPPTSGAALAVWLVGLVAWVVGFWGKLAIVVVASDPAVPTNRAYRVGLARVPVLIGLTLLVGLGFLVLLLPLMAIVGPVAAHLSSYDAAGMAAPLGRIPAGQRAIASLYVLAVSLAFVWLLVRLAVLSAVVVNEHDGLVTFRRSFQITHGHFWRLLGVLALFGVVIGVATIALQAVVGIVARLIVGAEHLALVALIVTLFTAVISAIGNVVVLVFTTQFYLLRREATARP